MRHLDERGLGEPPDEVHDMTMDPTHAEVKPGGKVGGDGGFWGEHGHGASNVSIEVARRGALVCRWSTTTAIGVDWQVPPNNGDCYGRTLAPNITDLSFHFLFFLILSLVLTDKIPL